MVFTTHYDEIVSSLVTRGERIVIQWHHVSWRANSLGHGAVTTAISKRLASRLRLRSHVDTMTTISATCIVESPCHCLIIQVADDIRFESVKAVEYLLENHDIGILIGMKTA